MQSRPSHSDGEYDWLCKIPSFDPRGNVVLSKRIEYIGCPLYTFHSGTFADSNHRTYDAYIMDNINVQAAAGNGVSATPS